MARHPARRPPPPPPQSPSSDSTDSSGSSDDDEEEYLFQKKPSTAPPSETAKSSSAAADDSTSEGEEDEDDDEGSEDENAEEEEGKLKEKPNEQEDEEGSSEEEEEEEEEMNANNQANSSKPPKALKKAPPPPPPPESEADTSSSESDDEAPLPSASRLSVKPISSGPVPTAKPFQRIWSIQDELAILRGMAEYRDKHGIIPTASRDMLGFLAFIKDSLGVEVTNTQLADKVRKLKNKFITAATCKNSTAPTFSKPHDRKVYQLSKKIWGPGNTALAPKLKKVHAELTAENTGDDASARDVNAEHAKKHLMFPYLSEYILKMDNGSPFGFGVKRSFELMDSGKATLLETKVKKLKLKGMRIQLTDMDLIRDSIKLVVDSLAAMK